LHRGRRSSESKLALLAWDRCAQTQLELRLGSAEERLVDLRLVGVEGNVGAGAVRVALEDDVLARRDLKEMAELYAAMSVYISWY